MTEQPQRRPVDEWAAIWKLVGPILCCIVGLAGFLFSLAVGHDATFGTLSLGLAAAGAGLSADILRRITP